jgi:hypothetical protein
MAKLFNYGSKTANLRAKEVPMTDKTKSRPVHKIRAGAVELAIWKNDGEPPDPLIRPSGTFSPVGRRGFYLDFAENQTILGGMPTLRGQP